MKTAHNKKEIIKELCKNNTKSHIILIGESNNVFGHEEADVSMISYMKLALDQNVESILIVCDDTDVFVLLLHFFWKWKPAASIHMKRMVDEKKTIDINATAMNLGTMCEQLLAVHALSGCDTVSYPYRKGKVSALSVLKNHLQMKQLLSM